MVHFQTVRGEETASQHFLSNTCSLQFPRKVCELLIPLSVTTYLHWAGHVHNARDDLKHVGQGTFLQLKFTVLTTVCSNSGSLEIWYSPYVATNLFFWCSLQFLWHSWTKWKSIIFPCSNSSMCSNFKSRKNHTLRLHQRSDIFPGTPQKGFVDGNSKCKWRQVQQKMHAVCWMWTEILCAGSDVERVSGFSRHLLH